MKHFYWNWILKFSLVSIFVILVTLPGNAQNALQHQEFYGDQANSIVPGANFVKQNDYTILPTRVTFNEESQIQFSSFINWLKEKYQLNADYSFIQIQKNEDDLGNVHYRYILKYQETPVDLNWLNVHVNNGSVYSFNGYIQSVGNVNKVPGINEESALKAAIELIGAKTYLWQSPKEEELLKNRLKDNNASYYPEGILVLLKDPAGPDKGFRLAWQFEIRTDDIKLDQKIFIDASTGVKIKSVPLVFQCDVGTVSTTWNGTQSINTDENGDGDFILLDDCGGAEIHTTTTSGGDYINSDNTWTAAGETGPATTHYHGRVAMDYFSAIHGRDSYNNAGGDLELRAINDANAYWYSNGLIRIGSLGSDANYYNTLDVVAHEFTHGIVETTSNLEYQGESGALNESFCDILGETCEVWNEGTGPGSWDWLHREDYYNGENRSFINPKDKLDPSTYEGVYWMSTAVGDPDVGGVHTNSGVQNHWFYLLTVGGSGSNDNSDDYNVDGIGLVKARTISYDNLTTQLGENSDYSDARDGAIAAAIARYGACSNEVIQVKNAWYAVGVGNPGGPTFNTINTSPAVCSGVAFSIDLQSYRTANFVTPIYRWFASYPAGISGGNGDCLGDGCGTSINETLYNNTTVPLTVTYTLTRVDYDGCRLPAFSISKVINPRPIVSSSTELSVDCSGDPFSINLQNNVTNGVPSNFSWTVNYNGLTNGSGNGSGDYINETLINLTGSAASAVYTVTAYSEQGSCEGPSFTVTVPVPPVLNTSVDATSDYNGFDISCNGGSDGVAEAFPVGGTPPYSYSWNDPNGQTTKVATGLMALTYSVVVTDANGCELTNDVTLTEPDPLTIDAGENQTVYYGYPPAECADIAWSGEGGGVPPYTITWDDGGAKSHQVCPGNTTTTYTVTITDDNGCVETDEVTICVIDVRCGKKLDKVEICHVPEDDPLNTQTLCVSVNSVATHLAHGDMLAACGTDHTCSDTKSDLISLGNSNYETTLSAYPNPFSESTTIEFTSGIEGKITIQLYDFTGRMLKVIYDGDAELATTYEIRVDAKDLSPGLNLCVLRHSDGTVLIKKLLMHK